MDKVRVALVGAIVFLMLIVMGLSAPRPAEVQTTTFTTTATTTSVTTSISTTASTSIITTTAVTTSAITSTVTSTTTTTSRTTVTTMSAITSTVTSVTTARTTVTTTLRGELSWEVYFSPKGGAADRIVYWLNRANSSVCAMIYTFTSDDISAAFIRAYQRGVDIKISMDDQQLNVQGGEYQNLVGKGVPVRVDKRTNLLHNKVAVIDGKIVITGSYNWSAAAEEDNRENLIIILDPALASIYQQNCEKNWDASTPP